MIDVQEIKSQILDFVEESGPTIPVKIAKQVNMDPVWASAILAELVNSKKLIMSSMKLGASPYYLKPGQEPQLASLADNVLGGTPKEAFLLLGEKKFLKDNEQEPQIRVALRSLKDFATPFEYSDEVYWRYNFVPKSEIENLLTNDDSQEPVTTAEDPLPEAETAGDEALSIEEPTTDSDDAFEEESVAESGSIEIEEEQSKGVENIFDNEEKIDLVERVRRHLDKKNIIILEETDIKKKEFVGIGRTQTELGEIEVTIMAKDKKNITDKDIEKAHDMVVEEKRLILFLSTGEFAKKAKEFYRDYKNVIRFEKLD